MSGPTGSPPASPKMQNYVDPKIAQFAREFMRRLSGDTVIGNEPDTLAEVLEKYAAKDASGKIDWAKTADQLVKSLDELIPDKVKAKQGGGVEIDKHTHMQPGAGDALKDLIKNAGDLNAKDMAAFLAQKDVLAKDGKKFSLFDYLYAMGSSNDGTFDVGYNADFMQGFAMMLNGFQPGLGGLVTGLLGYSGAIHDGSPEAQEKAEVREDLALAFDMIYGGQVAQDKLARLWGLPTERDDGTGNKESIHYTRFEAPGFSFADQFFDGTWRPGEKFDLGQGGPLFKEQSFDAMVVQHWVDTGMISFKTPQDRADFAQYAKNAILGGQVGPEFVQRLEQNGDLVFKTPQARQDFKDFVGRMNMPSYTSTQAAQHIIEEFLKNRDDVEFKTEQRLGTGETTYNKLGRALSEGLSDYTQVHSREDWANRLMRFAEKSPGTTLNLPHSNTTKRSTQIPFTEAHGPIPAPTSKTEHKLSEIKENTEDITANLEQKNSPYESYNLSKGEMPGPVAAG